MRLVTLLDANVNAHIRVYQSLSDNMYSSTDVIVNIFLQQLLALSQFISCTTLHDICCLQAKHLLPPTQILLCEPARGFLLHQIVVWALLCNLDLDCDIFVPGGSGFRKSRAAPISRICVLIGKDFPFPV